MAAVLVGNTYIGISAENPGSVGFGYFWAQSDTGNYYARDTGDASWVFIMNLDQLNGGMLPLSGGTMSGAILGAHGLMPLSGGDFTAAPTISGNEIATQDYVTTQINWVLTQINALIAQSLASIPGVSVTNQVAVLAGISPTLSNNGTYTLPLPVYGDGTTATQAEVAGKYYGWPGGFNNYDGVVNLAQTSVLVNEVTPNSRTFQISVANTQTSPPATGYAIGYIIVAIRS